MWRIVFSSTAGFGTNTTLVLPVSPGTEVNVKVGEADADGVGVHDGVGVDEFVNVNEGVHVKVSDGVVVFVVVDDGEGVLVAESVGDGVSV